MKWRYILTILFLAAGTVACTVRAAPPSTLALVDISTDAPLPPALMDLLFAAFSDQPQVTLVERARVHALLTEQSLASFAGAADDPAAAMRLGELCQADAFILLEAGAPREGVAFVRIRVTESRYGLRVFDGMELLPFAEENEVATGRIRDRVLASLSKVPKRLDELFLIGVSVFRNEEPSRRWDWLADVLPAELGGQLSLHHGIFVLEREKTSALTDERALVSGLPERLQAATLLIDGSFRLDRALGPDTIVVRCRCRRAGDKTVTVTVTGDMNDTAALCRDLGAAILQELGAMSAAVRLDAGVEAAALAREAFAYTRFGEFGRALGPAEAAVALAPGQPEYGILLLRVIRNYLDLRPANIEDLRQRLLDESVWFSRGASLATRLLRLPAVTQDQPAAADLVGLMRPHADASTGKSLFDNAFGASTALLAACPDRRADDPALFAPIADRLAELRAEQRELLAILDQVAAAGPKADRQRAFLYRGLLMSSCRMSDSTFEAMKCFRRLIREAVRLVRENSGSAPACLLSLGADAVAQYQSIVNRWWWPEPAEERVQMLRQLCQEWHHSRDPLLRAYGTTMLLVIESNAGDFAATQQHMTTLIQLLVTEIQPLLEPRYSTAEWDLSLWLRFAMSASRFAANREEESEIRDALYADAARQGMKPLESSRHADPGDVVPASAQYRIVVQLREAAASLPPELKDATFRRVVSLTDTVAILCSTADRHGRTPERFALLRFSRNDGRVVECQICPDELAAPAIHDWLFVSYNNWGPSVVSQGDVVVVGTPWHGLRAFPPGMPVVALTEKTGLPSDAIRQLEVMGKVLYVRFGRELRSGEDSGVAALDLQSWRGDVLWSVRDKEPRNALSGLPTRGIAVDEKHNQLWVLSGNEPADTPRGRPRNGQLYVYAPATGLATAQRFDSFDELRKRRFGSDTRDGLERSGNRVLLAWKSSFWAMNLESGTMEKLTWLPAKLQEDWIGRRIILAEDGLLVLTPDRLAYRCGHQNEWTSLQWQVFPERRGTSRLRDALFTPDGLYVLADDRLVLFPDIAGGKLSIQDGHE